jgi:hypothetical protein
VTALLGRHTVQARQMLRKLLVNKIELEPVGRGRERGYRFRGALWIGVSSVVRRSKLACLWWPQRDSNPCSRIAARFCQRINDLRRVESTRIGGEGNPARL